MSFEVRTVPGHAGKIGRAGGRRLGDGQVRFFMEGYCAGTIADEQGAIEAVVFSEAFQRHREKLAENRTLFFAGDVDASREEVCVRVHGVYRPREAPHELAGMVQIHLPEHAPLGDLRELLGDELIKVLLPLLLVACGKIWHEHVIHLIWAGELRP